MSADLPVSEVIPSLDFRDIAINSGGLCDLQFVLIQLVERSKSGLEYVQLLTASFYLFDRCFEFLSESIKEAKETYEGDDKVVVLGELVSLQLVFKNVLDQFAELHLGMCVSANHDRINSLRRKLSEEATQDDYRSHLLISDGLLKSLGLNREDVDQFIKHQSSL
ncbi:MAG TPA: hypothetical protein DEP13_04490 [Gammaproteobacteria bacterium]|nr:hypothetical protein [Gammaproteobacteria bacterium]